jgi:hypothetical protein
MGGRFTLYLLTTYDGFINHKPELAGKVIQLTRVITAITPSEQITAIKATHRRTGTKNITLCLSEFYHTYGHIYLLQIPSGKLSHNYGKIHHFSWENPL